MLDAKELKERLGNRAKDIMLSGLNQQEKNGKIKCCFHADSHPSMSWFKDGYMFRCHACGENMDIFRYYTEMERISFNEAVEKVADLTGTIDYSKKKVVTEKYKKPQIQQGELSKEALDYMKLRGITEETLKAWGVKERVWNGKKVYVFNYLNEHNELDFVSYRKIGKCGKGDKGGCEANSKSILWGMNHIDKEKPLVITEGQPDAMVVWQSGYKNVVSVPAGSNNLKWIENCWEWLQGINEIIVWYDNDEAGAKMGLEIKQRLKNVKLTTSERFKDANELLHSEGAESVLKVVLEAIRAIPSGLINVSDLKYKSCIENRVGGIETGFIEYDSHVEDWKPQELTVIFGRNGEGKTTFVSQVIAHNLFKKVPVFLYSGEMSDQKLQDWIYKQIVGANEKYYRYLQDKYKIKKEIKPEYVEQLKEWHDNLFYLFDRSCEEVSSDMGKFFEIMEMSVCRYGVKLVVIDNLMSKLEENADSLYSDQANFVQMCKNFAIKNNVHVVLLAHPNKEKKELDSETDSEGNLAKTDISGSNNIANKADNIISVERIFHKENVASAAGCDALISSLKDRETGERKVMRFNFSKSTFRYYNEKTLEKFDFGWESKSIKVREEYMVQVEDEICPF